MKGFFKIMLATMAGMLLLGVLMFVLLLVVGFASMSGSAPVKPNSVLVLDVRNAEVQERVSGDNPYQMFAADRGVSYIGLNDWDAVLKNAADDQNIKGVSLELGQISASPATLEAMRDALLRFKKSGKFVYAYGISMSQGDYYLATAADSIFLHPVGTMMFNGLSAQVMFYKELLDKLDVDVQIVRHGAYKSAVEPFISRKMSEANREQVTEYLQSVWGVFCKDIATARKIDEKSVRVVADNLMLFDNPHAALSTRFVDGLAYDDVYRRILKTRAYARDTAKVCEVAYSDYLQNLHSSVSAPYKVAVVYATGTVVDGEGGTDEIGSDMLETLRKLREEKSVKAVVLRINSGGGSGLMSEQIWREVTLLKRDRPVIVSMGDYAASGGYYIACAADRIVAEPTTITGSIGVFWMVPSLGRTLSRKLGVDVETVNTNSSSDWLNGLRTMTESEYDIVQQSVDRFYDTFVRRVADGRRLGVRYVDGIAQGRVWTGEQALGKGLVDTLGGLDLAIRIAAEQAKLSKYAILERPVMENFFSRMLTAMSGARAVRNSSRNALPAAFAPYLELERTLRGRSGVQAMLPYQITIR